MDPNTSIIRLCLGVDDRVSLNDGFEREGQWEGPEYEDTADSGKKKKDTKSFTFYQMETEEINQQDITPCFVDGLHAYDGEINLEDDVEPGVVFGRPFLRLTKGIVDFRTGIITIYPDIITFNDDSDDELDAILASIDVTDLPPLDITDIPPFMFSMEKEELSREELEKDIWERIMILSEKRPVIETLKYSDKHKKLLESVLLEKIKLDGELELEEEANEEMVTSYKAIKEKKDPRVFVLPIRLEAKFDFHALADTGSNINVIPYLRKNHGESDSDDEEEYCLKMEEMGKPFYGPNHTNYLSCDDPIDRALAIQEAFNHFKKISRDGKWHTKIRVTDPYGNIFEQGCETRPTNRKMSGQLEHTMMMPVLPDPKEPVNTKSWKKLCSHVFIMIFCFGERVTELLKQTMLEIKVYEMGGHEDIFSYEAWRRAFNVNEPIYTELCHEFYSTYEFDEVVMDDELMMKKLIKFRLGGREHTLNLLEFSRHLGLYRGNHRGGK
nr:hypothetical protein [Tanacetum cinerariifolium]